MTLLNGITAENLNLDSESSEWLWDFWKYAHSVRPIRLARQLFPNTPKGYVRVTKDLGNYAANKATAINCRLEGKIESALMYEAIADTIYSSLPEYAKW
jgi:hypothetical protein